MAARPNDFKKCLTEKLLDYAAELANCIPIRAVMVYADVFRDRNMLDAFVAKLGKSKLVLVSRENIDENFSDEIVIIKVPHIKLTRLGQMKIAILVGVSKGIFHPDDVVLCLSGIAESGFLDALFVLDIGDEFEFFDVQQLEHLSEEVRPEVFLRVLEIAVDLAVEGREGKPIGTLFIVGDTERVLEYCEQLVLNPFKGYSEEERNILDPRLEETVKEFASLDGAFIIRGDGVIETAGAFIKAGGVTVEIPPGLGTRHRCAAAITAITNAIAITVSESTGTVMVFYGGKIIMEIERPMIIGSLEKGETMFGGIPAKEGLV